jgi:hypothetical protein
MIDESDRAELVRLREELRQTTMAWDVDKDDIARLRAQVVELQRERDQAVGLYRIGAALAAEDGDDNALIRAHQRVADLLAALEFCEAADIARRAGDQSYEDDRITLCARAALDAATKGEAQT